MSNINYKDESKKYQGKYEEYHNKFWKIHHQNKDMSKKIEEFQKHIDILENNVLYGKIVRISDNCDYGLINHVKYGDIFFHRSKCNFQLSNLLVEKKVKFNLTITKRLEGINVELVFGGGDISSAFDLLEYGINYSSDNSSDNSLDNSSGSMDVNVDNNDSLSAINDAEDIWYLNAEGNAWDNWEILYEYNFMYAWNNKGRNNKIYKNLKVGDIIVWYMVGKGYIAVTQLIGECCNCTDKDKLIFKGNNQSEYEAHKAWELTQDCVFIKIPVKFLSHQNKNKCIKGLEGWDEDWTSGLRGTSAMRPTNKKWKDQVIAMYEEMEYKE